MAGPEPESNTWPGFSTLHALLIRSAEKSLPLRCLRGTDFTQQVARPTGIRVTHALAN
jgi:hypothetical protein